MLNLPSRPAASTSLQAQLEVLRTAYAARLDDKIASIGQAWAEYLAQTPDGAATSRLDIMKELHRAAHTLAGSGATFGFPAVSRAARRAEVLLKPLAQGEIALNPDLQQSIEGCLSELARSSRAPEENGVFSGPADASSIHGTTRTLFLFSESGAPSPPPWAASLGAFGYEVAHYHRIEALDAALRMNPPAAIVIDCVTEPLTCGQGDGGQVERSIDGASPRGEHESSEVEDSEVEDSESERKGGEVEAESSKIGLANGAEQRLLAPVLAEAERRSEVPTPVVWVCARGDLRSRLQSVRLGGAAFFAQPLDVHSLLVKLDDLTAHSAPEPFRVLIVDDEPSLGHLFSIILRQAGMECCVVSDPLQVMAPLVDFRPDVILMDVYMPNCSGVELASVIRQQEAYVGIPIMFLSVETSLSRQLEAMRQGGDDFLIKPVQPRHLIGAVTTRATRARVLAHLMVRDSLTGLLNHTKIKEQLEIELSRARRVGTTLCLAMLDIDHFKTINDRYGHATGDRVLRSLSRFLGQRLRQTDVLGRYGGEEFALILTGSNAGDARQKLDSIRAAFANLPHYCNGHEFRVTFSAGIASAPPHAEAMTVSEAADRALYEAKRAGRNRVVVAE